MHVEAWREVMDACMDDRITALLLDQRGATNLLAGRGMNRASMRSPEREFQRELQLNTTVGDMINSCPPRWAARYR